MKEPIAQGPVDVNVSRQCTCHPDDNPPTPCEYRYTFQGCADAAEERYLRETLAMLHESYTKAAKPYIDRLVVIHARRPPAPVVMSIERLHDLWEMKMDQGMPANAKLTGVPPTDATKEE